jgi:4-carboxymuconolactone decarboxylase
MPSYYNDEHVGRVAEIGDDAPMLWKRFQDWYGDVFSNGALSRREKSLVALAVAHAIQCPYSIDAYAEDCIEKGYSTAQMTEVLHVAAAVRGGATLMHGMQMRESADRATAKSGPGERA